MGLDPGFRTGVKVTVVDGTGKPVTTKTIYPHEPQCRWDESVAVLAGLAAAYQVELIAIGNGTASRETDRLAGDLITAHPELRLTKVVVSEAGASVYSASAYASRELPGMDVSLRGRTIARLLQDPLPSSSRLTPSRSGSGSTSTTWPRASSRRWTRSSRTGNAVGVDPEHRVRAVARAGFRDQRVAGGRDRGARDANGPFRDRAALVSFRGSGRRRSSSAPGSCGSPLVTTRSTPQACTRRRIPSSSASLRPLARRCASSSATSPRCARCDLVTSPTTGSGCPR
jgi:uncharacterized protein